MNETTKISSLHRALGGVASRICTSNQIHRKRRRFGLKIASSYMHTHNESDEYKKTKQKTAYHCHCEWKIDGSRVGKFHIHSQVAHTSSHLRIEYHLSVSQHITDGFFRGKKHQTLKCPQYTRCGHQPCVPRRCSFAWAALDISPHECPPPPLVCTLRTVPQATSRELFLKHKNITLEQWRETFKNGNT